MIDSLPTLLDIGSTTWATVASGLMECQRQMLSLGMTLLWRQVARPIVQGIPEASSSRF